MNNLFDKINANEKDEILRQLETHYFTFKKNNSVLSALMDENIICVVENGYLQLIRTDYNGNTTIIEELEENSVFGSTISSIKGNDYDIISKEDSTILVIEYNHILNNNNNASYYNQFLKNLLSITTNKISDRNERIEILTKKTIRNKLLEYFNIISKKNGSKHIYLPYNFSDLANFLAIDRCAMTREMSHLKEEGFIEVKGKRITLLY